MEKTIKEKHAPKSIATNAQWRRSTKPEGHEKISTHKARNLAYSSYY
jgi:hypothetical protein